MALIPPEDQIVAIFLVTELCFLSSIYLYQQWGKRRRKQQASNDDDDEGLKEYDRRDPSYKPE
jgi:hypothetical protein